MFCPCCGHSFRKFLPVKERINSFCPGCGSMERHRLIYLFLKYRTNFFSEDLRVLHISPNQNLQIIFRKMLNLDYLSINLTPGLAMLKMDVTKLLFDDNSFDVIICNHVLEHVSDDKLAMREIFRVLKPKGWGIAQVPIDLNRKKTYEDLSIMTTEERISIFGEKDHLRIYGVDYVDKLKNVGFHIRIDDFVAKLDENLIERCGLDKSEKIFYVFKDDNNNIKLIQ